MASVSRGRELEREQGSACAKPMGGDPRSQHIEAHGDLIISLYEATADISLQELRAALAEQSVTVGYGGLWRFFCRRSINCLSLMTSALEEPQNLPKRP